MEGGSFIENGGVSVSADTKWQLGKNDVRARLAHLRASGDFSDCVLVVGIGDNVETFQAHGMVLCMSSPKFEELLLTNKSDGAVCVTDIEPKVFHTMLDYMYLDKIDLKCTGHASAVYKAAVKYCMPHLCEVATKYMVRDMNFDSLWPVLQLASEVEEPLLKNECWKFVRKNPLLVLRHANFLNVDQNVVNMIVELDCLDIPEAEIVTAIEKWAEQQCINASCSPDRENKRSVIGPDILSKLRFLAVSQEEFVKGPAFSDSKDKGLLTLEESYAILMNIIVPGSYPMPDGFSSESRPRKLAILRCVRNVQVPVPPTGFAPGGFITPPTRNVAPHVTVINPIMALASPAPSATTGWKNFSLEIKVDHPIVLYGIHVPTLGDLVAASSRPLMKEYFVSFTVTVLDASGIPISNAAFAGNVAYGSEVDIYLKESIILQKNISYKIQLNTCSPYFFSKKLSTVEDCPPVKFTFKDMAYISTMPAAPSVCNTGMKQETTGVFGMKQEAMAAPSIFGMKQEGTAAPSVFNTGMKQETHCSFVTQLIYSVLV